VCVFVPGERQPGTVSAGVLRTAQLEKSRNRGSDRNRALLGERRNGMQDMQSEQSRVNTGDSAYR
jgi:hypothetical protein